MWGRCRGVGREPYETMVDHAHVAWRCTCPSRSHPCKHALALLIMWVKGQVPDGAGADRCAARGPTATPAARPPPAADRPEVRRPRRRRRTMPTMPSRGPTVRPTWSRRARRAHRPPARAGWSSSTAGSTTACAPGSPTPRWLGTPRGTSSRPGSSTPSAGGLANRVRRLAGVVGARPDWHEVVLAELGILHLLADAGQRLGELPGGLADAVATSSAGRSARPTCSPASPRPTRGSSPVAATPAKTASRSAARGCAAQASGRWAMVLSFAAYRQSLDTSLVVGTRSRPICTATRVRVAGADRRSARGRRHPSGGAGGGATSSAHATRSGRRSPPSRGSTASRPPSSPRRRSPAAAGCSPTTAARWRSAPDAPGVPTLLAASAGRPITVTVEWTIDGCVPLTVHLRRSRPRHGTACRRSRS